MKIPETPEPYELTISRDPQKFNEASRDILVLEAVKKYNEYHIHWDALRRRKTPTEPEIVWALMKLARAGRQETIRISDLTLSFNVTNRAQHVLHLLDRGAADLIAGGEPLDEAMKDRFAISSLMEEAIASSQLEGAVTTTKEAKRMLREGRKPRSPSERMIVNDYRTMQRLKEIRDQEFTVESILELHKLISSGTLDDADFEGRFREDDETVVADPLGENVYHRPPPHGNIHGYMESLCEFANCEDGDGFQHPLVKAVAIHFMTGYVHPFIDGNGRLARALMYWHALKNDYWLFEYMAISRVIKERKGRYGLAYLCTETDDNDLTYFINFNLDCMKRALEDTRNYVARKRAEQKEAFRLAEAHPELNLRQAEIWRDAAECEGKGLTIAEVMSRYGVVHQTARTDLNRLVEMGLLDRRTVGNKMYYSRRRT
jgi:Fic family protein